jgi:hypothetical protein
LFDKADKDKPAEQLDDKTKKSEFEQYYLLQKRSKVTNTLRSIYFTDSDHNKDRQLNFHEIEAHEAMIKHFTKTVDKTKGELVLEPELDEAKIKIRLANALGKLQEKTAADPATNKKATYYTSKATYTWKDGPAYTAAAPDYGWTLTIKPDGGSDTDFTLGSPLSITKALWDADAKNKLAPKDSILKIKSEVNGLIWSSLVTTGALKTGIELTDTNSDKKISRAEDSNANLIVHDFEILDTYTPIVNAASVKLDEKTPVSKANN